MRADPVTVCSRECLAPGVLREWMARSLEDLLWSIGGLNHEELRGPAGLSGTNPMQWSVGHVAFFVEANALAWIQPGLATVGEAEVYDSMRIPHPDRWATVSATGRELEYAREVWRRTFDTLGPAATGARTTYLIMYSVVHLYWHVEDILKTRQMRGLRAPADACAGAPGEGATAGAPPHTDVVLVPAGTHRLGVDPDPLRGDEPLVFDSDTGALDAPLGAFEIDRTAVTNRMFALFVEAGGYSEPRLWSAEGWRWRLRAGARHPAHWRRPGDRWRQLWFGEMRPLPASHPVQCVNWHEAEAYCRWVGRRLPSEAEWERAAGHDPRSGRRLAYPWGSDHRGGGCWCLATAAPGWRGAPAGEATRPLGTVDVNAFPEGDSPLGCRQMLGNTWEWTASPFTALPGYRVDVPYSDQSAPWFDRDDRKVLRGGSWATSELVVRNTYRNFQRAEDREWFAGFRTVLSRSTT